MQHQCVVKLGFAVLGIQTVFRTKKAASKIVRIWINVSNKTEHKPDVQYHPEYHLEDHHESPLLEHNRELQE